MKKTDKTIKDAFFDTESLYKLDGTGDFQCFSSVLWKKDNEIIDLTDTYKLTELMKKYRKLAKYDEVKFINRILSKADLFKKNSCVTHYPEVLQIEHSEICNAKCIMCNHVFTKNHSCTFMDRGIIDKIERVLPYVSEVGLNGIGEPLLHPDIMQIIELYEKYQVKLTTNTNLSVMNSELANLMHRTFSDIQISCDGASKDIYEKIRRELSFEKFIENAKILRKAGDVEICMATVVMRQNITQLPKIVELAADLGCNKIIFLDLNTSDFLRNRNDSIKEYIHVSRFYMDKAREMAQKKDIFIHLLEYVYIINPELTYEEEWQRMKAIVDLEYDDLEEELHRYYKKMDYYNPVFRVSDTDFCCYSDDSVTGICDFADNRPFISAKGDVFLCCTRRMHSFGSMKESLFESIWNSDSYQTIRSAFYHGVLPRYCVGCAYLRGNLMENKIRVHEEKTLRKRDQYDVLRSKLIQGKMREK